MKHYITYLRTLLLMTIVWLNFVQNVSAQSPQRIGYDWKKIVTDSSYLLSIVDKENNIVVAGKGFIEKLDIEGNLIWLVNDTLIYNTSIAIDNESNIYTTGKNTKFINPTQYYHPATSYIYIAKYNKSGDKEWVKSTNIQTTNYKSNFSTSIACDLNNSLYITGSYSDSISFDTILLTDNNSSAIFIAKYDTSGTALWAKKIFGINSNDALTFGQGNEIVIDKNNFIYLTGTFRSGFNFGGNIIPAIGEGIFLTKFDGNGTFIKTITLGENNISNSCEGDRMIIDKNNNLILLAKFGGVIFVNGNQYQAINNSDNAIVIKFTNDSIVFATQIGRSNGGDINSDICLDKNQNIIYVGTIAVGQTAYPLIYKIDTLGGIDWSYMVARSNDNLFIHTSSLISDTSGGIYLAGSFFDKAMFGDSFLGTKNGYSQAFIGKIDTTKHYPNINFSDTNSSSILLFPTLTNGVITLMSFTQNLENSNLNLYNVTGQIVKKFNLTSNKSEINVSELSSGLYIIEIKGENFSQKFKIIKY